MLPWRKGSGDGEAAVAMAKSSKLDCGSGCGRERSGFGPPWPALPGVSQAAAGGAARGQQPVEQPCRAVALAPAHLQAGQGKAQPLVA